MLELIALFASLALPVSIDDNPTVDPKDAKPGNVYQWQSADGLAYEYRVPKGYDPERGANVTMVLHGNGLDHRWTFWNHPAAEFRVEDIVVSPDGTTAHAGTGANEFLAGADDIKRVEALLLELEATWNVRQVFLYGHSQGAFFVYYFAGAKPELVDGVVGHAGGVWNGTEASKKGHRQAIGFLHGTDDHIPYGQAVGGREFYAVQQKYPLVHLRTLFDWNHRPHWYQAAQVLAWCEGMTSDDPARVAASLADLEDEKRPMGVDWSARHAVAQRLAGLEGATPAQIKHAEAEVALVEALAQKHVDSILKGAGKGGVAEFSGGAWVGELLRFREDFYGTPQWADLDKRLGKKLDGVIESGRKTRKDVYEALEKDDAKAVELALELIEKGHLDLSVGATLDAVDAWVAKTKTRLPRKSLARYEALAKDWREGRAKGFKAFEQRNGG